MGRHEPVQRLTWRHVLLDMGILLGMTALVAIAVSAVFRETQQWARAQEQLEADARSICDDPACRCRHYREATPHARPEDVRD